MSVRTMYGDLTVQGNANFFQNLTVQGAYSTFLGNVLANSSTVGIGNVSVPFGNLFSIGSNVSITNVQTLTVGSIQSANVVLANGLVTTNVTTSVLNVSGVSNVFSVLVTANAAVGIGPTGNALSVQGNVWASNALATTNLVANIANVSGTLNVSSLVFGSTGTGNVLDVRGNVWVSNALATTNLFVTTINALSLANIGTLLTNLGPFTGNVYVSNVFTTTNVFATLMNAATLNVLVQANVANLNVLSGYVTSNANGTRLNTVSIFGQSGSVGIGTTTGLGANLQVQGNVFASNGLSGGNIAASGTITYNEDLFRRGPYLAPSSANAAQIQAWISATCNAVYQTKSYWVTSGQPVFSNIARGPQGSTDYGGSVLLPDGRVLLVPQNASNIGFYSPTTGLFSSVAVAGITAQANKFRSAVLVPNGNVVLIPWQNSNVGLFNPLTYQYSNIQVGAAGNLRFQGGVLGPTGNVIMVPRDSANIGVFNPTTLTMTNVGPIAGQGLSLFGAGALLPNGNLVMSPLASPNIGMYNTYSLSVSGFTNVGPIASTGTWETAVLAPNGNVVFPPASSTNVVFYNPMFVSSPLSAGAISNIQLTLDGSNRLQGGCLLPSGNIVCCPADCSNIGMIDPIALTYSNCGQVWATGAKFYGCSLALNGQVVFVPSSSANVGVLSTLTPPPREFCMCPLFNKF